MRHEDGEVFRKSACKSWWLPALIPRNIIFFVIFFRPFLHSSKMHQFNRGGAILSRPWRNSPTFLQVFGKNWQFEKIDKVWIFLLQRLAFGGHLCLCLWLLWVSTKQLILMVFQPRRKNYFSCQGVRGLEIVLCIKFIDVSVQNKHSMIGLYLWSLGLIGLSLSQLLSLSDEKFNLCHF